MVSLLGLFAQLERHALLQDYQSLWKTASSKTRQSILKQFGAKREAGLTSHPPLSCFVLFFIHTWKSEPCKQLMFHTPSTVQSTKARGLSRAFPPQLWMSSHWSPCYSIICFSSPIHATTTVHIPRETNVCHLYNVMLLPQAQYSTWKVWGPWTLKWGFYPSFFVNE